ncbi:hypothetical protein KP509_35G016600 [Ceratopteris richardii]|uniref:Uncharacterized protein n=1 Tax=Ceratopteris richardii TaxID=49495 RepID=A0A8T2QDP1_CERRI|nr:hypothetical protein KP509_35G016600 [Ceratopteris richardii]
MTTLKQGRDPLLFQIGRIAEEIESAHIRNANPRKPRVSPSPRPHHAATQQASSLEEGHECIAQELASLRVAHHQSSTAHCQSSTTQLEMCVLKMRATTHRRDFPLFRLRHAEEVERAA